MGWNSGFNILAKQAISLYDQNLLTKEILGLLMKPFHDSDIDTGDSDIYKSKDGKDSLQVICFIMEKDTYLSIEKKYNYPLENTRENEDAICAFTDEVYDLWKEIKKQFM